MIIQSTPLTNQISGNRGYKGIDAAKTGFVNEFENYPDLNKRLNKAIGGKRGNLPYFFQFSKNGRKELHLAVKDRKNYCKPNRSTMNRICMKFEDIKNINFSKTNVAPFNWQMLLLDNDEKYDITAVTIFCTMDDGNRNNLASASSANVELEEIEDLQGFEFVKESIIEELAKNGRTLEQCYPSIVKYLFAGANMNKVTHKQMFWRVFGEIAYNNLVENMKTYSVCDKCGMKIPAWASNHSCPKDAVGFFECVDCGTWCQRKNGRQIRCESCQKEFREVAERARQIRVYNRKKGA